MSQVMKHWKIALAFLLGWFAWIFLSASSLELELSAKNLWIHAVTALAEIVIGFFFLWVLYKGVHLAYAFMQQVPAEHQHLVLLEIFVDFGDGDDLPTEYWEVVKPYFHSTPMSFYLPWSRPHLPRIGETIRFSGLDYGVDEQEVTGVQHGVGDDTAESDTSVTYIALQEAREDTSNVTRNLIYILLALSEQGFQMDSDKKGKNRITDILKKAGLPTTWGEYKKVHPEA